MNTFTKLTQSIFLMFTVVTLSGQGTVADYNRADSLASRYRNMSYYSNVSPVWAGESNYFSYETYSPEGKVFILVDPVKKTKREAFNTLKLSKELAKQAGKEIKDNDLPISNVKFNDDLKSFTFVYSGVVWTCYLPSYRLVSGERVNEDRFARRNDWLWNKRDETSNNPVESPDGNYTALIKNYNLFIRDKEGTETQLSFDGGIGFFYSSFMHWSPDSKKIMAYKVQPAEKHMIQYIESSPESQLQPKYYAYEYAKPGDALPQFFPQIFDIETKSHIRVDESPYQNQYDLGRFQWRKNSSAITFEYNRRGHQLYQVVSLEAKTGKATILVDERSDTFIDYSGKRFRFDVNDGEEIIWSSERDGWNHLYLLDGTTGELKNQITRGNWVVRDVEYVDEINRQIIFMASGREEGDPYLVHYYIINFDGSAMRRLTDGYGNHTASFSPDRKYFTDTWSTVDTPPVSVLRKTITGAEVMPLERADISRLIDAGWRAPEVFSSKARDGVTDIWGIIIRPTNFDPSVSYPVIEDIYAGPHSSFVPKSFREYLGGMQALAELGFIVVKIDGMGTSNRSKAFHDICFKNLKDAGLPDRILWIKEAASKYPYMDISRVGVYGTSAGGQSSTGALLFHPEFYKVAVSACGCHDNRMDKIWWNEQWMGWPVGPEYAECSNVDNAYRLEGKLLLINGEMDNNVDPASTIQVVNALIKADKDFEYLFVPGMKHSSGGTYGEHKRRDFFVRHLLGIDPPEWSEFAKE